MAIYPTLIAKNALNLKPAPPEFQRIFANTVGDAATPLDGFPVIFNAAARATGSWSKIMQKLRLCLAQFGVASKPIATPFEAFAETSLAATISAGQPLLDAFAVHLTGKNPPGAQPSGPPIQGGGGLQPVAFGTLVQGAPSKTILVPFQNPFNFAVHPTGVKIEQGHLQVFVAVSECGATVPANGICKIAVTFRPLLVGHYVGLLVFSTDDPNSPYTLGISGTVIVAGSGGGGGGFGGVAGGGGGGGSPIFPRPE